jgi:hypothetical protein
MLDGTTNDATGQESGWQQGVVPGSLGEVSPVSCNRRRTYKNSQQVFRRSTHLPGHCPLTGSAVDSSIAGRHRPGGGTRLDGTTSRFQLAGGPANP